MLPDAATVNIHPQQAGANENEVTVLYSTAIPGGLEKAHLSYLDPFSANKAAFYLCSNT